MPLSTEAVGKRYDPLVYAVGREKIREYALAVGETDPLHLDVEAARAAGYADVVAPPMFAVVYSAPGDGARALRPRGRPRLLADGPRRPGVQVGPARGRGRRDHHDGLGQVSIEERAGKGFYVFESVSTNQDGDTVAVGTWTNIVRGI